MGSKGGTGGGDNDGDGWKRQAPGEAAGQGEACRDGCGGGGMGGLRMRQGTVRRRVAMGVAVVAWEAFVRDKEQCTGVGGERQRFTTANVLAAPLTLRRRHVAGLQG